MGGREPEDCAELDRGARVLALLALRPRARPLPLPGALPPDVLDEGVVGVAIGVEGWGGTTAIAGGPAMPSATEFLRETGLPRCELVRGRAGFPPGAAPPADGSDPGAEVLDGAGAGDGAAESPAMLVLHEPVTDPPGGIRLLPLKPPPPPPPRPRALLLNVDMDTDRRRDKLR